MTERMKRQTADLSGYPDLVVIYLGMRLNKSRRIRKLLVLGQQIRKSVDVKPESLLVHESLFYAFFPFHVGMRQYWRDFASLESWTRTGFHRGW